MVQIFELTALTRMPAKTQAEKNPSRVIKRKMLEHGPRGMSVTKLAEKVGHPISTVSRAINHGRYPRVRAKIERLLNVG